MLYFILTLLIAVFIAIKTNSINSLPFKCDLDCTKHKRVKIFDEKYVQLLLQFIFENILSANPANCCKNS